MQLKTIDQIVQEHQALAAIARKRLDVLTRFLAWVEEHKGVHFNRLNENNQKAMRDTVAVFQDEYLATLPGADPMWSDNVLPRALEAQQFRSKTQKLDPGPVVERMAQVRDELTFRERMATDPKARRYFEVELACRAMRAEAALDVQTVARLSNMRYTVEVKP